MAVSRFGRLPPVVLTATVSILFLPDVPLVKALLYGTALSAFASALLRAVRTAKTFGLRFLIITVITSTIAGLLMGILSSGFRV